MIISVTVTKDDLKNLPRLSKKDIEALEKRDIVYDEDSPKLTQDELKKFRRVNRTSINNQY